MFGEEATVSCGDISVYLPQVVTIQYSLYKGDTDLSNVSVKVYFNMSYVLNVCFFPIRAWIGRNLDQIKHLRLYRAS